MRLQTYKHLKFSADDVIEGFKSGTRINTRVTTVLWRHMLLNDKDKFITDDGEVIHLTVKNLGAGVYEITVKKE